MRDSRLLSDPGGAAPTPRVTATLAALALVLLAPVPALAQATPASPAASTTDVATRSATPVDSAASPGAEPPPRPRPAAAAVAIPITFFGELRTRSEVDRPGGALPGDAFTYLRTRFGARVDVGQGTKIVLQIQDSRVLGAESNRGAAAPDVFDLHQGYVELATPWRDGALALRAGRQEIALANERLVGAVAWSNTGRSFDGLRLLASAPGSAWSATAFGATIEERGRRFGTAATTGTTAGGGTSDHVVAGLFVARAANDVAAGGATKSAAAPRRVTLESTLLYDAGARYRSYADARRVTLDARLRAPLALGLGVELEGAWQAGRQALLVTDAPAVAQDVAAWLFGARLGTAQRPDRRTDAAVGLDWLSGDRDPSDGRYTAFNTLYATNHPFYGVMDLFLDPAARTRDRGLVDALATGSLVVRPRVTLKTELHHFALATGSDRPLGWEADIVVPVRVTPAAGLELGYSAFRAERGAAAAGLGASGDMRHWGYAQLKVGF